MALLGNHQALLGQHFGSWKPRLCSCSARGAWELVGRDQAEVLQWPPRKQLGMLCLHGAFLQSVQVFVSTEVIHPRSWMIAWLGGDLVRDFMVGFASNQNPEVVKVKVKQATLKSSGCIKKLGLQGCPCPCVPAHLHQVKEASNKLFATLMHCHPKVRPPWPRLDWKASGGPGGLISITAV